MRALELFLRSDQAIGQALDRGLPIDALAATHHDAAITSARATVKPDPGGDPNSLLDQGWGVIASRGEEGERLLALAAPLLEKRAGDQDAEVTIYRVKPDMDVSRAARWLRRTFLGDHLEHEIPGYVLILGGFDLVSLELQQVLSIEPHVHVGRLAFDREDQYEAYIAKLLRSERATPGELARALFFTARDGTPATDLGHRSLMGPSLTSARSLYEQGRFPAQEFIEIAGHRSTAGDDLLAAAADERPAILFSCSHGLGPPRDGWPSLDEQRARQGALCLGKDRVLSGDRLRDRSFLPDGVWVLFACFGAGTPAHSAYAHWLRRLAELGEHAGDIDAVLAALPPEGASPFVAAAPQAALANPRGPLAVIGHIDLAWSYSFVALEELGNRARHNRFVTLLQQLARGSRAGLALSTLLRARERVKLDIAITADREQRVGPSRETARSEAERVRLGHRWMLHQDIDGYIVLGDPAARLAIDPRRARRQARDNDRGRAP